MKKYKMIKTREYVVEYVLEAENPVEAHKIVMAQPWHEDQMYWPESDEEVYDLGWLEGDDG